MARLWIETQSDRGKGTGKGASEHAICSIYWGSAGDSKLAGKVAVSWPKGAPGPSVHLIAGTESDPVEAVLCSISEKGGEA